MKAVFVETRNTVRAREALSVLEDIEGGQPGLACFYGEAGRGKTIFARHYTVQTGAVYLRVLEDWTPRAMLAALCRQLNGSEPNSVDRCKRMACEQLETQRRTLLVDEVDRLSVNLIEHLRDIHDISGVPVILIGEQHLFPILNARKRLWSRVTQVVEFKAISTEDIILYAMRAADLKLHPEVAARIESRSGGDFRLVFSDIRDCEQMARAAGTKTVDIKMVQSLSSRRPGASGGRNGN